MKCEFTERESGWLMGCIAFFEENFDANGTGKRDEEAIRFLAKNCTNKLVGKVSLDIYSHSLEKEEAIKGLKKLEEIEAQE